MRCLILYILLQDGMDLPVLTFPSLNYDMLNAPELIKKCKELSRRDMITGEPRVMLAKKFFLSTGMWLGEVREDAMISVVSFTEPCPTPMPVCSMKRLIGIAHYGRDYYFIRIESGGHPWG